MRAALTVSVIIHAGLLLGLSLGLPRLGERLEEPDAVTVEIVAAADAPPSQAPTPAPAEAAPLPPREAASTAPPPPLPPAPELKPEPAPEPPPPAPPPEPEPQPPPPPPPEPAPPPPQLEAPEPPPPPPPPEPEPAPEPPPPEPEPGLATRSTPVAPPPLRPTPPPRVAPQVAEAEPKPAKEPKPEAEALDFDELLRSVEDQGKRVEAEEVLPGSGKAEERAPKTATLSEAEFALIGRQLEQCWRRPDAGQGRPQDPFEVRVNLDRDGRVERTEILDQGRVAADPAFRALVESAQRGVYGCRLDLPAEKYVQWRDMILTFYP